MDTKVRVCHERGSRFMVNRNGGGTVAVDGVTVGAVGLSVEFLPQALIVPEYGTINATGSGVTGCGRRCRTAMRGSCSGEGLLVEQGLAGEEAAQVLQEQLVIAEVAPVAGERVVRREHDLRVIPRRFRKHGNCSNKRYAL